MGEEMTETWKVTTSNQGSGNTQYTVSSESGAIVYSVAGINKKADAYRIAAAPEMYEAVTLALRNAESALYMLPASDNYKVSAQKDILSSQIGTYRAALAKADGKPSE